MGKRRKINKIHAEVGGSGSSTAPGSNSGQGPGQGQAVSGRAAPGQPASGQGARPAEAPGRPWPAWAHRAALALACLYLAVQLAVPVNAIVYGSWETRTDFSWDMFAVRRDCEVCVLMTAQPGQAPQRYGWGKLFKTTYQAARVRSMDKLPIVAREVCRRERAAGRADVQVFVDCKCRYNNAPELIDLDPFGGDYCSEEAARRFGGEP